MNVPHTLQCMYPAVYHTLKMMHLNSLERHSPYIVDHIFNFIKIMICPGPVRVYLSAWLDYTLSEGGPR